MKFAGNSTVCLARAIVTLIGSAFSTVESETYDIQGQYWIGLLETNPGSEEYGDVVANQGVGTYIEHARNSFYSRVYSLDHKGAYKYNDNVLKWGVRYQNQMFDDIVNEWEMSDSAGYTQPHFVDSILNPNNPMQTPLELKDVAHAHNELYINTLDGYLQLVAWVGVGFLHVKCHRVVDGTCYAFRLQMLHNLGTIQTLENHHILMIDMVGERSRLRCDDLVGLGKRLLVICRRILARLDIFVEMLQLDVENCRLDSVET